MTDTVQTTVGDLTDEALDKAVSLTLCRSIGGGQCLYLNDFRLTGGKPDYRGNNVIWDRKTTLREVIRAFPELQKALGFNHLGKRVDPTND